MVANPEVIVSVLAGPGVALVPEEGPCVLELQHPWQLQFHFSDQNLSLCSVHVFIVTTVTLL